VVHLQLVEVTPDLENRFLGIVEKDYCDYYFFIYDWLYHRSKTRIFLALENGSTQGIMVVYDGHIVQIRGQESAIECLLNTLKLESVDLQVPLDCEHLLIAKYPFFHFKAHITLMYIKRGWEKISFKVTPERLSKKDADEIVELMHEAYHAMWHDIPLEVVLELLSLKETLWFGIKRDGKLVSFGYAMLTSKICHLGWIATRPGYEQMGFATSIVSSLVQACLEVAEGAIIFVMDDNFIAKKIYSMIGFTPYKSYAFIRI
jgi:hypothetical protein